ncbi:MAG TPA: hypothetical protein ENJ20_03910, partial [Bacteroidetes bacterium]|nr:hypothetical protein [Bacteroidota bacterium]
AAALALFILMLMFDNPNQSFFGGSRTTVGDIEGEKIEYQEFNQIYDMLYSGAQADTYAGRNYLWNYFVDRTLVNKEAEAVGLGVSKPELLALEFGPDPNRISPLIKSRYQNPNTRQVDMEQLNQMKDIVTTPGKIDQMIQDRQLVADFKYRWAHQEREIVKEALQTKLSNMIAKGLYTPTWMAEMLSEEQNKKVDFAYVQVPYDEIDNSDVALEEADYQNYFEENKQKFWQPEETRKVEYVEFVVKPSAADSANIRKEVADLIPAFRNAENDSLFVETNLGTMDNAYFKKNVLPATIADTVFNMPVGEVYGPYVDGGFYKAVKVIDRKIIPDSVSARHILRRADDLPSLQAAQKTIDSLKTLIETGVSTFEELAKVHSEDASNAGKGGDLGTFGPGTMVKEFNDVCFFKAETGKVYPVVTQFGVHLIQVYDKKFVNNEPSVQLAFINREIVPGQATQDEIKEMALELQEECPTLDQLRTQATAKGLTTEVSAWLRANDYAIGTLGSGQGARDVIKWAFGNSQNMAPPEVGDVAPRIFSFQERGKYYVSKYAVAGLHSIRPEGIPPYQIVKEEIEAEVLKVKKAELLKSRLAGMTDLRAIADKYASKVDTARNVSFSNPVIPTIGTQEPEVVAEAFKVELNQVSAPIAGSTGVFVVIPLNKPVPAPANADFARQMAQINDRAQVTSKLLPSLRKNADIEDNRARFY